MEDFISYIVFYVVGFQLIWALACVIKNKSYKNIGTISGKMGGGYMGIGWGGTAEEDAAYRTFTPGQGSASQTGQGFNLQQWFTDQGIEGDRSYYRYAMIRGISEQNFREALPGNMDIQNTYTYSGTSVNDQVAVGAQNIVPIESLGIDTYGRPLPEGYTTKLEKAALRTVNAGASSGGQNSAVVAPDLSQTGGSNLTLNKLNTLGSK